MKMQFGSLAVKFCLLAFIAPLALARMSIVHSAANFSKCLSTTYQGEGANIELAECHFCDARQHIPIDDIVSLESSFDYFKFSLTNECLSNNNYVTENGEPVLTYDCSYMQTNQQWKINGDANSAFQLQLNEPSICLTYDDAQKILVQSSCESSLQQTWIIEPLDNQIKILGNVGSSDKCLRYLHASVDSVELEMVKCSIHDISQLVTSISFFDTGAPNGIRFVASNKCLYKSTIDGCIFQKTCADVPAQYWVPHFHSDGSFSLKVESSCLSFDGRSISLQDCEPDDDNQRWSYTMAVVEPNDILLKNRNSGKCFSAGSNGNAKLCTCNPDDNKQNISPIGCGKRLGTSVTEAVNIQSGELCFTPGGSDEGSQMILFECSHQPVQDWFLSYIDCDDHGKRFQIQSAQYQSLCLAAEDDLDYMYLSSCQNATTLEFQVWTMMLTDAK